MGRKNYFRTTGSCFGLLTLGILAVMLAIVCLAVPILPHLAGVVFAGAGLIVYLIGLLPLAFNIKKIPDFEEYQKRSVDQEFKKEILIVIICGLTAAFGLWSKLAWARWLVPLILTVLSVPGVFFVHRGVYWVDDGLGEFLWKYSCVYCIVMGISAIFWLLSAWLPFVWILAVIVGLVGLGIFCFTMRVGSFSLQ